MGVTAANVPNFLGQSSLSLGDLQDLTEVVKALMLQADAPPGRVRTGTAKAVPAHDPPEGGVYFEGKFYAKNTYFRPRAGLVQDMAFKEGLKEPCFLHGHGLLPLAQSAEASGVELGSAVAGGIAGIRYAPELTAPRIAPGGIIELPTGGGGTAPVPLAQWNQEGGDQVAGLVKLLTLESVYEKPAAYGGQIYFPLAATVDASGIDRPTAVAGAIAGIRYAEPSAVAQSSVGSGVGPRILPGGIIELPPPSGGTAEVPLARWDQQGGDQVPGLVQLLTLESVYEKPAAYGGQIYFPLAATVDEAGNDRTSAVAGAIAGIRYAPQSDGSAVGAPRILPGGIIELPRPDGALQGVVDTGGGQNTWSAIESGVHVQVAQTVLSFPGGSIPLSLFVGIQNGFLSFSLSDST